MAITDSLQPPPSPPPPPHHHGVAALVLANALSGTAGSVLCHRKNCMNLAIRVGSGAGGIRPLLNAINRSDLARSPYMVEPLQGLAALLHKALSLMETCRDSSYLYMVATGWHVVNDFWLLEEEMDSFFRTEPLVSLVNESRIRFIKDYLQAIQRDHKEYTLEEEEMLLRDIILKSDRTKRDVKILEISLSNVYPNMKFHEALQEEKEKLHIELQRSQSDNDMDQCRLIEQLIGVTEGVISTIPSKKVNKMLIPRYISNVESMAESLRVKMDVNEWQADLSGRSTDPCLRELMVSSGFVTDVRKKIIDKHESSMEPTMRDIMDLTNNFMQEQNNRIEALEARVANALENGDVVIAKQNMTPQGVLNFLVFDEVDDGKPQQRQLRGLETIKLNIPQFDGKGDVDDYFEWEDQVEKIFECYKYDEEVKVRLVALEFIGYASLWWKNVLSNRKRIGIDNVATWDEMKQLLHKRFVPYYHRQESFMKLYSLKQDILSVEDYVREFETLMFRCEVDELPEQTIARFVTGLKYEIASIVELQQFDTLEDVIQLAIKVERQRKRTSCNT